MNFQHLAYWQEKAKNLAIETRLFINGEYCAAADNTTFETIDPAAQQTLAQVARGKKADVERAVKAARQTFDNGDWSQASPAQRKAILTRFADLMEAHREELALLETLDTGKPIRHSLRDDIPGAARAIRWYAEALDKVYGEVAPIKQQRAGDDRSRTNWRDRRGGAVELPAAAGLLETRPGAGGGQ